MKKLSWLLVLAMLLSIMSVTASAEGTYTQAPMLDARVEAGELPPVEERLPEEPRVAKEILDEYHPEPLKPRAIPALPPAIPAAEPPALQNTLPFPGSGYSPQRAAAHRPPLR